MENITDSMKTFFERIRDERSMHANTADRIGNAFLMILNYLLGSDTPFLRKDREDVTRYLLTMLAGAVIGESGRIRLNPDGSIICDSIKVNGSAIFDELVFNNQNVIEGDTYFTNRGVIERVESLNEGRYRVFLRKQYQDDIITFQQNDILKCSMNNLDAGHTFKNSWMRVNTVNTETNSMDVVLYANNEVPGGANYAPVPGSVIIRWGNQTNKERQGCWYLSSTEKRIVMLDGVTQPKLKESNYASFYGLPFDMENFKGYTLNKKQPYLYVRGAFLQDVCFIDYLGKVVKQERYRGVWSQDVANNSDDPYIVTKTTFDTVYHKNAKWQCNSTKGTKEEPSVGTTDWTKLSEGGKGKDGINAPRVLYFNSDTRPNKPTSKNPSNWSSIPLRPVAVSNMRAEKTSRADYSFGKVTNAINKEYWGSLNKGIYNSIAEALIYFDADSDGTVRFDWYAACGSANKASIYKVNSQVDTVAWEVDGYKTGVYDATVKKGTNFIRVCYEKGEKNTDEDRLFIRVLDTSTSRRIWVVTEILTPDGEYAGWSDPVQWTGNDGRNLTKVTNYYKWGTSGNEAPSGEYTPDAIPEHVEGLDYLWNYEVCSDDNGTTISQSGKTCIGYFPKNGEPGKDGKGIKSITEYYQVGTEKKPTKGITVNSNNELDTTGWSTTMEPTTNENRFVWNQEVIQFTDGTYSISVIHLAGAQGDQGDKGENGADAKILSLRCDRQVINCDETSSPWDDGNITIEAVLENLSGTVTWSIDWDNASGEEIEDTRYEIRGNVLEIIDTYYFTGMCYNIYITARLGQYSAKTTIVVVNDGTNGKNGANGKPLVGPTEWSKDVKYLSGKSNEAYQSIVINPKYPKQMYLCGYTHTNVEPSASTSVSSVNSCTWTKPWVQVTYQDFVATKVLFAERGKVENLDITNATIQGTITDMAVKTEAEWDAITNSLVPKEEKDYVESKRNFQIVDPSKAGSYFIPTFDPRSRELNTQIVFLPTYNPSTDYDIITCNTTLSKVKKRYNIPKYQIAGTHIRITKGGAPLQYSRWAYLEDAEYDRLWTSNNTINRETIRDIYNMGTLICADHKIFKVTDGNGKHGHNITGAWYYGDSDYKHGRLSVNGTVARMLWLMPGQTVELVSQIEEINNTKCLVWSVVNASDFTAVNINADVDRIRDSNNDPNFDNLRPIEFHGESGILAPDLAGNADNWADSFIAHKKIDNLLLNGETKEIPSLFIKRTGLAEENDYPSAEFYLP